MNGIVKVDLCELDSLRDRSKLLDEMLEKDFNACILDRFEILYVAKDSEVQEIVNRRIEDLTVEIHADVEAKYNNKTEENKDALRSLVNLAIQLDVKAIEGKNANLLYGDINNKVAFNISELRNTKVLLKKAKMNARFRDFVVILMVSISLTQIIKYLFF